MPYTDFRFIAYEVPTATNAAAGNALVPGYPAGQAPLPVPDITVPTPAGGGTPDWYVRLLRLAAVVDLAGQNLGWDNDRTLKVFMAPEFYFRPPQPPDSKSYPVDDFNEIWNAFEKMFQARRFRHWLIVGGTAISDLDYFMGGGVPRPVYRNTLLTVRGCSKVVPARLIEKTLASHIDGVPRNQTPGLDPTIKQYFEKYERQLEHFFHVDGVTMGAEICLDHADGDEWRVLKNLLYKRRLREGAAAPPPPMLHLIAAGGMCVFPGSVAARTGGYVLRNDGYPDVRQSELHRVLGYERDGLPGKPAEPWNRRTTARLSDIAAERVVPLAGAMLVPGLPAVHRAFPQVLRIYPAQPLR